MEVQTDRKNEAKRLKLQPAAFFIGQNKLGELLESVPETRRAFYRKSLESGASLRAAINAKCHECNCFEESISRTRECKVYSCPLWNVRPYQKGDETEE